MPKAVPREDLLFQIFDRLSLQERLVEANESSRTQPAPTGSLRSQVTSLSSSETPPEIPWPKPRDLGKTAEHINVLEARLAEADKRLRIAERLETMGRLLAGVSHDFNNLLTIISGHAEVICNALSREHPLWEIAELISITAHTAAGVTRQLVEFGKPDRLGRCPVDANASVRALERTLERLAGGPVTLTLTLAADLPLIQIDPGQFDQVLLNLVANARDAIRDAGGITVRTAAETVEAGRAGWPAEVLPGDFVVLSVTDNGVGMTEEVKARVFDLYFTTKGARGSGLGLATVKEIVTAAGGHIEFESWPDWGTCACVYLPVYPERHPNLHVKCSSWDVGCC
jgi:signal transduction histidine kinase